MNFLDHGAGEAGELSEVTLNDGFAKSDVGEHSVEWVCGLVSSNPRLTDKFKFVQIAIASQMRCKTLRRTKHEKCEPTSIESHAGIEGRS